MPTSKGSIDMQSGQFLSATAANRKKRELSAASVKKNQRLSSYSLKFSLFFSTVTCDQATGSFGNLFTTTYIMKYPPMYRAPGSQQRYLNKMQNAIRTNHRRITVTMNFTDGETRSVELAFCSFTIPGRLSVI